MPIGHACRRRSSALSLSSFPIKTTTTPCEAATSAPGPGTLAHVTTLVPNRCASRTTRSTDLTTASPAPTRSVRLRSPHGFDQGRLGRADACPMLWPLPTEAHSCHIGIRTGLTPAHIWFETRLNPAHICPLPTSGSRLGSPLPASAPCPYLRRDWACACHICTGTGHTLALICTYWEFSTFALL